MFLCECTDGLRVLHNVAPYLWGVEFGGMPPEMQMALSVACWSKTHENTSLKTVLPTMGEQRTCGSGICQLVHAEKRSEHMVVCVSEYGDHPSCTGDIG